MHANTQTRIIYILKYLWENTDENHIATLSQIVKHLSSVGIYATNKTVANDIAFLEDLGIDIVCIKSTQNRYFIGLRVFEQPEVKMLIDAIHAAPFISKEKTATLLDKMHLLVSKHQLEELKCNLVVSKPKYESKGLFYTIDALNTAINQKKQVHFQYIQYDHNGKRALKHNGYIYTYSPIAIVWNMDSYYVVGFSKKHDRIIKFRIDKIVNLKITDFDGFPAPPDLDLSETFQTMFLMYGDKQETVTLRCSYDVMDRIIDRFGEDIQIIPVDEENFEITEPVMVGTTFFSWLFNYGGKIHIILPESVKQDFKDMLHRFDDF